MAGHAAYFDMGEPPRNLAIPDQMLGDLELARARLGEIRPCKTTKTPAEVTGVNIVYREEVAISSLVNCFLSALALATIRFSI